jgi:hypothetical protein
LKDMDFHSGLTVSGGREDFALAGRDGRVAGNENLS